MTKFKRFFNPLIAAAFLCLAPTAVIAQPLSVTLTGKVTDAEGEPIHNAVVMVKTDGNLLAAARTLTNTQGDFGTFTNSTIELNNSGQARLFVRKAGYLPDTNRVLGSLSENVGTISLVRDPIEYRIDSIIALMNTAQKIAQMTQPHLATPSSNWGGN
ncbi:MAG: carboxypeptidase-like regulatory domain-containing protein, partial [Chitinispirillales bacterium]|nr:carboxypeptidase-like regulatory domain-containing protein [Chitinispirillales bacterium]